jgi:exodeoxyribonuclease VII small subunit
MPRRKANPPDDDSAAPSFEEALTDLEAIVEAMENEQLPLEDLVSHYEKGSKLLKRCESVLQSARERIELITLDPGQAEDSQAAAADEETDLSDDFNDENDIRLF